MKTILIFFLICSSVVIYSQDLTVSIELNKTEFHQYNRNGNDSVVLTYKIKNTGDKTVLLRLADGVEANYTDEDGSYHDHCFRTYTGGDYRAMYKPDYQRTPEAFVTIEPGGEIIQTSALNIGWVCRGGAPRGDWKFNITYNRTITEEDNYCMFKSRYSESYNKESVEGAWTGTLKSNSIEIIFNRD